MPLHRRIFYLLVVLLPVQLGYHVWPSWSYVLGRRIDYLSPTLYLTDIVAILLVIAWAVPAITARIRNRIPRRSGWTVVNGWKPVLGFLGIAVYVACNILLSVNPANSLLRWGKLAEFVAVGAYVVAAAPDFRQLAGSFAVAVCYSAVLAIWQFVLQHSAGGVWWWLGERTFTVNTPGIARLSFCIPLGTLTAGLFPAPCPELLRPYATFPHPNVLAGYLAVSVPLLIGETGSRMTGRAHAWYLFAAASGSIALGLTFSRSAWTAAAVIGAGLTCLLVTRRRIPRVWVPLALGAVLAVIVAIAGVTDAGSESVRMREDLTRAALHITVSHPLTGIGLGNFIIALPAATPLRSLFFLQPVHNIVLLAAAETGIVGIAVLFLAAGGMTVIYFRKRKSDIRRLMTITPLPALYPLLGLAALLGIGMIDHYPITLQQGQLILTLYGAYTLRLLLRKI